MKYFNNLKMTLFDSTNAAFKLAVELQFTRKQQDGSSRDLVYTTDKGTSVLNPNIYLTMSYKDDQMNAVYTSYPQLYKLRKAFGTIRKYLEAGDAFIKDPNDQSLSVKQTYAEPIILDNIGKGNNWIQLKLEVMKSGENGVFTYAPAVSIQLSTSNGFTSLLSDEEFLTVATIIDDLNLANFQMLGSLGFLNAVENHQAQYGGGLYPQWQYQTVPGNFGGNQTQPTQQPPMNGNWSGRQQNNYQRPSFNQPRQSYRTTMAPQASAPQVAPVQQPAFTGSENRNSSYNTLPPRENKPLMNPAAIDATPVSQYDIDDAAAIDSIFNGNN